MKVSPDREAMEPHVQRADAAGAPAQTVRADVATHVRTVRTLFRGHRRIALRWRAIVAYVMHNFAEARIAAIAELVALPTLVRLDRRWMFAMSRFLVGRELPSLACIERRGLGGIQVSGHLRWVLSKLLFSRPVRKPDKAEIDVRLRRESVH